jgi:hypothetical protein
MQRITVPIENRRRLTRAAVESGASIRTAPERCRCQDQGRPCLHVTLPLWRDPMFLAACASALFLASVVAR